MSLVVVKGHQVLKRTIFPVSICNIILTMYSRACLANIGYNLVADESRTNRKQIVPIVQGSENVSF